MSLFTTATEKRVQREKGNCSRIRFEKLYFMSIFLNCSQTRFVGNIFAQWFYGTFRSIDFRSVLLTLCLVVSRWSGQPDLDSSPKMTPGKSKVLKNNAGQFRKSNPDKIKSE